MFAYFVFLHRRPNSIPTTEIRPIHPGCDFYFSSVMFRETSKYFATCNKDSHSISC